jgi:tRNA-splicing endonuclease subunit Sen54
MPSIHELSSLFDEAPVLPPPVPRRRRALPTSAAPVVPPTVVAPNPNLLQRLFPWIFPRSTLPLTPVHKPNPFMALKAGKKIVIIAVVDAGNVSFFRFGQGAFSEWPMA